MNMKCTDLEETFYGNESYGCNHQLLAWPALVSVENVKIINNPHFRFFCPGQAGELVK